ncbi:hypothetical protein JS82_05685 [Methanomassiliicoccaceae archaeon DOK]|nr:hypothetical protein JS82_05685 [Methanomassiliicoccaceae archaeon DOK]
MDRVCKEFKKALKNHVKYFARSEKTSSMFFVLLEDDSANDAKDKVTGTETRLNKILEEHLNVERRNSIRGKILNGVRSECYACSDLDDYLYRSFTFKVLDINKCRTDKLKQLLLTELDGAEGAVDSRGNPCYLFDITSAKPDQAFLVCKLSAQYPLYTVCFRDDPIVLSPFPKYVKLNDDHIRILNCLKTCSDNPSRFKNYNCTVNGYLYNMDVAVCLEIDTDEIGSILKFLHDKGLISFSNIEIKGGKNRRRASKITDDGEFMLRYAESSR